MSGNFEECIVELNENEKEVKLEARRILFKLCDNVLKFPDNVKYRKINLSNPLVMSKLLPASGAMQCLFEAGFVEVSTRP